MKNKLIIVLSLSLFLGGCNFFNKAEKEFIVNSTNSVDTFANNIPESAKDYWNVNNLRSELKVSLETAKTEKSLTLFITDYCNEELPEGKSALYQVESVIPLAQAFSGFASEEQRFDLSSATQGLPAMKQLITEMESHCSVYFEATK